MRVRFLSILFVFISIGCPTKSAQASIWVDYLDRVESFFDQETSPRGKYKIISEPVNREYIKGLADISHIDPLALRDGVGKDPICYKNSRGERAFNDKRTNALAIAISLADVKRLKKFLKVVEDINADELTTWGFRQPYYPAHVALNPLWREEIPTYEVCRTNQLRTIDLLAQKGADFNKIYGGNFYQIYGNPPLQAAESLRMDEHYTRDELRARAMLYGANPTFSKPSQARLTTFKIELQDRAGSYLPVVNHAFEYYCRIVKSRGPEAVRPVPVVMQAIEGYAKSIGFDLAQFLKTLKEAHLREEITLAIANIDAKSKKLKSQLDSLKTQKTKKARAKVRHHQMIGAELQNDRKKLEKTLRQLTKSAK